MSKLTKEELRGYMVTTWFTLSLISVLVGAAVAFAQ